MLVFNIVSGLCGIAGLVLAIVLSVNFFPLLRPPKITIGAEESNALLQSLIDKTLEGKSIIWFELSDNTGLHVPKQRIRFEKSYTASHEDSVIAVVCLTNFSKELFFVFSAKLTPTYISHYHCVGSGNKAKTLYEAIYIQKEKR